MFGPNAELLGLAVAKDILPGEVLLSAPCSARNDYNTIMASEIGPTIRALDLEGSDEELFVCLYYMFKMSKGEKNMIYYSLNTAQPPDLPLGWTDEEISFL